MRKALLHILTAAALTVAFLTYSQNSTAQNPKLFLTKEEGAYSRVIAGCHWMSDTKASRIIATSVFARLQASPDYQSHNSAKPKRKSARQ